MTGTAQHGTAPVRGWVLDQAGVVEAAEERIECDLCLDTGERGAEAVVDATAEAEVLIVLTHRVETVRVVEPQRVPVAGGEHKDQRGTLGDGDARDFDVGER